MESLLPLIIAAVISIVISANKKKKKPHTPSNDPWGEVWEGLGIPKEEVKQEEPGEEVYSYEDEELPEVYKPLESYESYESLPEEPVAEASAETIASGRHFSYDDAFDSNEGHVSVQAASSISPPPRSPVPEVESSEEGSGLFSDGFDAKTAVLYAEVLKPKFQEY